MGLRDYVAPETTALGQRAENWESAVRQAGKLLEMSGAINSAYTQAMVDMVKQLGPYIVVMPGVALAHARPEGNVLRDSIAVVTYPEGVRFGNDSNDPVYVVFAIAARTDGDHLTVFQALAKFIAEEENIVRMKAAENFDDILFC